MSSRFWRVGTRWFAGLALALLLLAGCDVAQPYQPQGIRLHSETSRLEMITPELMCKAILVMDAGISGLGPGHWNTPDGTRPASADALALASNGYRIYTPIHFSSMHIHVDYRSQPTSEFDTVGGNVGPDSDSEGYPRVKLQQNYLLTLVYGITATIPSDTKTILIVNDAFPIDEKGMVTLRPEVIEEEGVVHPAMTMPLSQIVQQLANCNLS